MAHEFGVKEQNKERIKRGDLRWLNAITAMMLEEPDIYERKTFRIVEKRLSKLIPKLRESFREELTNEVIAARLFNFVPKLAALYKRRATKAEIQAFFDEFIEPRLCKSFGPLLPDPHEWREAVNQLLGPPDIPPTDYAIEAVARVLRAVGVYGVSRSDFMKLRKVLKKETKFPGYMIFARGLR